MKNVYYVILEENTIEKVKVANASIKTKDFSEILINVWVALRKALCLKISAFVFIIIIWILKESVKDAIKIKITQHARKQIIENST